MVSETMLKLGTNRSVIRDLFEYGNTRAAIVGRENVYDFSLGNPSVPSPKEVNEAVVSIIQNENSLSIHGYTSATGDMTARKAVAEDLNVRYQAGIRAENLFFTCGAAPALTAVLHALAVKDAEILALAPFFPEYTVFIENSGAKEVVVPADTKDFGIHPEQIASFLTKNTQAIIVNSPNNPSGVIYSKEQLTALASLLTEKSKEFGHAIYIIADEPYRELAYDGAEVPFIPNIYPNTIVCYSWSKSLSLPGERIGYVCVPDTVENSAEVYAAVAGAARSLGHVCAPSLWQKVIGRCASVRPDLTIYDLNRKTLVQALTEYGYECVYPAGAFYLLVRAPGGDANAFSALAKEKDLLIVPCGSFGCPEYLRISTCVSHEMVLNSLPVFKACIDAVKE